MDCFFVPPLRYGETSGRVGEERGVSEAAEGWTIVGTAADVPEGEAVEVAIEGDEVLLYRRGEQLFAISNRCTHQGALFTRGPSSPSARSLP